MGDTNMCTDNPILLRRTLNSPTIMCVQRKAEKKVVSEEDIVQANKLAFNDDIGTVTNRVTTMIEVQAGFEPGTKEYETLGYRIMCGQNFQQNTIDRAKGIIAKPMPDYWYSYRANMPNEDDTNDDLALKGFNLRILAEKKPHFMIYVYPALKSEYRQYVKNADLNIASKFYDTYGIRCIDDLRRYADKTDEMRTTIDFYDRLMPVGQNACVINRISWLFEKEFKSFSPSSLKTVEFDYSLLASNVGYSRNSYNEVSKLYAAYLAKEEVLAQTVRTEKLDRYYSITERKRLEALFERQCAEVCSNENELCDIVLDMCYCRERSKQFSWDICGRVILRNLVQQNGGVIQFPKLVDQGGDFSYCGRKFEMRNIAVGEEFYDYFE